MSFLHLPVFIVGSLCVAAPVLIHLMMRRKPQEMVFPALRFVKKRQVANKRSMRVRHLALLALRCLAVLAAAATFARPIIASAAVGAWMLVAGTAIGAIVALSLGLAAWKRDLGKAISTGLFLLAAGLFIGCLALAARALTSNNAIPNIDSEAPVAAAFLFDTSPRMGLVQESQSRLDQAREISLSLLRLLPNGSDIAILDTGIGGTSFAVDRAAAATEIEGLETGFNAQAMPQMIQSAVQLLKQSTNERREIYIFTDLTTRSWDSADRTRLAEIQKGENAPLVYVIDVGVEQPKNLALGTLRLSREHIARNAELRLAAEVVSRELSGTRTVELLVESDSPDLPMIVDGEPKTPPLKLQGQREVAIESNQSQWVEFSLRGLDVGTHNGQLRIAGQDGLAVDDVRYFSIEVHPPWPLLVVRGPGANSRFLVDALSPYQFRQTGQAMFDCKVITTDELATTDLKPYAGVALLDPDKLSIDTWLNLAEYTDAGNGLAIFLGRNAKLDNINSPTAAQLLPAQLSPIPYRAGADPIQFSIGSTQHPMLEVIQARKTTIPWSEFPIYRHWSVRDLSSRSNVILRFGNGKPAIVESTNGDGRVVMVTTPVSDALNVRGRPAWNEGIESWPYLVLVNEVIKYLVEGSDSRLNYSVGQTATLARDAEDAARYQLFHPRGSWMDVNHAPQGLTVSFNDMPGNYRLKSQPPGNPSRGYSVNMLSEQTVLDRITIEQLDEMFGKDQYQYARDQDSINRRVGVARRGHEFYPWAMLVVVFALALENLLSNRFYGNSDPVSEAARPTRGAA
ncbi:MAG: BatA domain-containing protein [Planctomycetota bacterium]